MKKVVLLGASGSIGQQSLDVLRCFPSEFELCGVSVGRRTDCLKKICHDFPSVKHICTQDYNSEIACAFSDKIYSFGDNGLQRLAEMQEADLVINALVGFVGFLPSLRAIESGKDLALANKETLVAGGEIMQEALRRSSASLYPIDSEHSAIWQCLHGNNKKEVQRLIITASGGSFRNYSRAALKKVSLADALAHPTWSMGHKITIDSATMMNKAFEIMEAHYLFDMPYEKIDVLLHDESIIHSLVEFADGIQLAQLGMPDMRLPIQFALRYPLHEKGVASPRLHLEEISCLHFRKMDDARYPLPALIKRLAVFGGNFGAVINGANDAAVTLFLEKKIQFLDIERIIFTAVKQMKFCQHVKVEDILEADRFGREVAYAYYQKSIH